MGKKFSYTPRSTVRGMLRELFLKSRERKEALIRENYTCQVCGAKQSKAKGREVKIEVHHKKSIEWDELISSVYKSLLCPSSEFKVMCVKCHKKEHKKEHKDD